MGLLNGLNAFIDNMRHVLSISYKPSRDEFTKSAKLIIIGILLIGVIGFVVAILVSLIIRGNLSLI